MALHTVLIILSLLPMLEAQNPEHANFTIGEPITNETLSWLSDKWFFMGAAFRKLEYRQAIQTMQSEFFYLTTNLINDTIELRESQTIGDQCVYNSTHLGFQRENGTFSKYEGGVETFPKGQISPRSCGKYSRRLSHTWAWMNQKSYLSTGKRIGAVSRRRSSLSWGRRPRKILRKARHELSSLNSEGCPQAHQTPPPPVHFDSVSATIKVC
ncbi:mCG7142, isoform CRA_e [Mus musculus]|nr:mCG7142, isoform CRA_e [Mus musculus]